VVLDKSAQNSPPTEQRRHQASDVHVTHIDQTPTANPQHVAAMQTLVRIGARRCLCSRLSSDIIFIRHEKESRAEGHDGRVEREHIVTDASVKAGRVRYISRICC
jgi:hypothetical protein